MEKTINSVKKFWENNPLFTGESNFETGSKEFFEEHRKVYFEDVFANDFKEEEFIPQKLENEVVLDLGCGIGFWTIEIQKRRNCKKFYSADLTQNALNITSKRLNMYNLDSELSIQNAEDMDFENNMFDHVNCQGVIHHTPNTEKTIEEIARVLKSSGTACISVYYKNFLLRNWSKFSILGKALNKIGGGMKGRGRESIFAESNPDEITRLYDGTENPIGKSYSKKELLEMFSPYFEFISTSCFLFPARSLPLKIPKFLHKFLSNNFGFMIHLQLKKKPNN